MPKNTSDTNISNHYFPKNREFVDIWKENCAITRPVKKTNAVCEKHFQSGCFKSQNKNIIRLKSDAFPTINLRATTLDHTAGTGFPFKDARLSKLKNIPYLTQ